MEEPELVPGEDGEPAEKQELRPQDLAHASLGKRLRIVRGTITRLLKEG